MELISREEVVKIINEIREYLEWEYDDDPDKKLPSQWIEINDVTFGKVYQNSFTTFLSTDVFDAVKNKLSRPKGEWVNVEIVRRTFPMYQCTNCKHNNIIKTNYCPHCGAEMEIK